MGIEPKTPGWDAHALSHQPIRIRPGPPGPARTIQPFALLVKILDECLLLEDLVLRESLVFCV